MKGCGRLLLLLIAVVASLARPNSDQDRSSNRTDSIDFATVKSRRHKSVSAAIHYRTQMDKDELAKLSRTAFDSLQAVNEDENKRIRHERRQRKGRRKDLTKYPLVTLPPVENVDEQGRELAEGWQSALGRTFSDSDFKGGGESCKAYPFKQTIKHHGCLTKVVVNRFCYGMCSSIYIPRMRSKKLKAHFESQSKCAPSEVDTMRIALECPGQSPSTQEKIITIVRECKCQAVNTGFF